MGKVKKLFSSNVKSLKTSFTIYITVCLLTALLISLATSGLCQFGQSLIYKKYQAGYMQEISEPGKIILDSGKEVGGEINVYNKDIRDFYSKSELIIDDILELFSLLFFPIWFAVCIIITGMLFYKKKLKVPLEILGSAADNISKNNLDFTVSYDGGDEMSKLCASFEKMRSALEKNNSEMWRQMEERKRLNAAFSHDLRTPLTVLKGHTDMLFKYVPQGKLSNEKITQTAKTMSEHIARLESYTTAMGSLQKLEDTEAIPELIEVCKLFYRLKETAQILCKGIEIEFIEQHNVDITSVDKQIIFRVYENLLSNATRYAKSKITITLKADNDNFSITVSDNGSGFDIESLEKATSPFYRSKKNANSNHFGLGLNICKILCEKHNGYLKIFNNENSGASINAIFNSGR